MTTRAKVIEFIISLLLISLVLGSLFHN